MPKGTDSDRFLQNHVCTSLKEDIHGILVSTKLTVPTVLASNKLSPGKINAGLKKKIERNEQS